MIEGGGSKTLSKAKEWIFKHPKVSHELLGRITDVCVDFLIGQVRAGAQVPFALDNDYFGVSCVCCGWLMRQRTDESAQTQFFFLASPTWTCAAGMTHPTWKTSYWISCCECDTRCCK